MDAHERWSVRRSGTMVRCVTKLNAGEFPNKTEMLALTSRFPRFDLHDAVAEAVEADIAHRVMPTGGGARRLCGSPYDGSATCGADRIAQGVDFGGRVVQVTRDAQVFVAVTFGDQDLDPVPIPKLLLQWMNRVGTGLLRRVWR